MITMPRLYGSTTSQDKNGNAKNALSKFLVSRRLRRSGDLQNKRNDRLKVVCNGEGVLFLEASTNLTINEFHYVHNPCNTSKKLLY